jgi:hypothetical protein
MTRLPGYWECYTGDTPLPVAAEHYQRKHQRAHTEEVRAFGRLYLGFAPTREERWAAFLATQ